MHKETESIQPYVTDLCLKSQSCKFGTMCDFMIQAYECRFRVLVLLLKIMEYRGKSC